MTPPLPPSRTVYSTESGWTCPQCKKPAKKCKCASGSKSGKSKRGKQEPPARKESQPKDGIVRIGRSTKGRGGKGVTIVTGIPLSGDALKEVAQTLKGKCGAGGTVKDGVVEIQGEHRELLQKTLEAMGYRVKQSGG